MVAGVLLQYTHGPKRKKENSEERGSGGEEIFIFIFYVFESEGRNREKISKSKQLPEKITG